MAEISITIDTDGVTGDYSSLALAEAGELVNHSDLVADGDNLVFNCQATTGVSDSTAVDLGGYTTGLTNDILISGNQTTGIWDDDKYNITVAGNVIIIRDDYVTVEALQSHNNSATGGGGCFLVPGTSGQSTHITIDSCIVRVSGTGDANGVLISGYTTNCSVLNTIIYRDFGVSQSGGCEGILVGGVVNVADVRNCTIYNWNDGIERDSGSITVTNCLVFGNGTDFDGAITVTYCASDDAKTGTGNFQITQTASNYAALVNDLANNDFSVTDDSSELYNAGTNTGAPSTDIIGTTRPQSTTVDIGAFELIVGSSGVTVGCTSGVINIAGQNPTLSESTNITASKGSLSISGLNPNIAIGTNINSALGLVSISGLNSSISAGVSCGVNTGAIEISGKNPTVSTGLNIPATLGVVNIAGLNPSISEGINIDTTLSQLNINGFNAGITTDLTISPNTGLIYVSGINPYISVGTDINVNTVAIEIASFNASVTLDLIINTNAGTIALEGKSPSISATTTINATQGLLGISGLKTNIALPTDINVSAGHIGITGFNPSIDTAMLISTTLGIIGISGLNPSVQIGEFVSAPFKRTYYVPFENRIFCVPYEERNHNVT